MVQDRLQQVFFHDGGVTCDNGVDDTARQSAPVFFENEFDGFELRKHRVFDAVNIDLWIIGDELLE